MSFIGDKEGAILSPWLNKQTGYLQIALGRKYKTTVYQLVAKTWLSGSGETVTIKMEIS